MENSHTGDDHSGTGPRIVVVGTGYVGLTSAACLAHLGRYVTAIDIDVGKIEALERDELPIVEAGLGPLVSSSRGSGRLRFEADYEPCATADIILLCLPTPHSEDGGLDLGFIRQAARSVAELAAADTIVVTKSTVPAGTHTQLKTWLGRPDLHVVANPEFLREGSAVDDFLHPDRIVIGAETGEIACRVAAIYHGVDAPIQLTDPTSAELIKYAANSFLATKLGFVNEISRLCDGLGADIAAVTAGIGSDHRIGDAFLQPGPGWGGSCFPKDTRGLTHVARLAGRHLPIAEAAYLSNADHLRYITSDIRSHCPRHLNEARVAVWGATFKAGTDDVRESPALEIISHLAGLGADVFVFDPAAARDLVPAPMTDDPYTACFGADLLLILTEWPEFGEADLEKVAGLLRGDVIYDARYVIDPAAARAASLSLRQPGRPGSRATGDRSAAVLRPISDGWYDPNARTIDLEDALTTRQSFKTVET